MDLISRKQAIDAINEYMKRLRIHIATPNDTESYSYARGLLVGVINDIKQLPSAEPHSINLNQPQSSDMISRQAVLDNITTSINQFGGRYTTEMINMWGLFTQMILQLPSAEPQTGKWIDAVIPNDNGGLPVQVCDQCNTFFPLAYTGGGHHYCPNCGCKMEVEHDT